MSSVRDVIVIIVMLFVVGIIFVIITSTGHLINVALLNTSSVKNTPQAVMTIQKADTALYMNDYIYLAFFISLFLSMVITGWFVSGSPILAPIYFFIIVIFTFIGVVLQLVWNEMVSNGYNNVGMPITSFILSHLGYFTAIFGIVGILVMFAKPGNDVEGAY